jgi:hypothetical protein
MNLSPPLTQAGTQRLSALSTLLHWLAVGGHVEVGHGHRIFMTEDAKPGFHMRREDGQELLLQIDSADVWMLLIDYATRMSDADLSEMAANTALTEINRKRRKE